MTSTNPTETLEHTASLKGLFKGKGQLLMLADACIALRDELIEHDLPRLLEQAHVSPLHLLPVQLSRHATAANTCFLRWRRVDRTAMGDAQWQAQLLAASTPIAVVPTLHRLEQQRVLLNAQISLMHVLAQLARTTLNKLGHAERLYQQRLQAFNSEVP